MEQEEWNEILKEHQEYIKRLEHAFQTLMECHERKIQAVNKQREAHRRLALELTTIQDDFARLKEQWQVSQKEMSSNGAKGALSDETKEKTESKPNRASTRDNERSQQSSFNHSSTHFIPSHLLCPLTHEPFMDPVVDHEGHTYEKEAILQWLTRDPTSPLTRRRLTKDQLVPNRAVKEAIKFWGYECSIDASFGSRIATKKE